LTRPTAVAYRFEMRPHATLAAMLAIAVALPAGAVEGGPSRARERLAQLEKGFEASPGAIDAELRVLDIWALWDTAGPAPVVAALGKIKENGKASPAARDRAGFLLATAKLRTGDPAGARADFARMGFIGDWTVAGPFDNEGGTGLDAAFGADAAIAGEIDTNASMDGKAGPVSWREHKGAAPFGLVRLDALVEPDAPACAYAVAIVPSDRAGEAELRIGASGAFRAFWNKERALADDAYRRADPDRGAAAVRVRKGGNRLVVKVCSESRPELGLYARLVSRTGRTPPRRPLDVLLATARGKAADAHAREAAARYMIATGAVDPESHEARDLARAACEATPSSDACLAHAALALDDNERRLALSRALVAAPRSLEALVAMSLLLASGPEPRRALPLAEQVLAAYPDDPEALGVVLRSRAGSGLPMWAHDRAAQALARDPGNPALAILCLELARAAGLLAEVARLEDGLLRSRFDDAELHESRARVALARGDDAALDAHLAALLAVAPLDGEVMRTVAELEESRGEADRAEEILREAERVSPDDPSVSKALGLLLLRRGRTEDGVAELRRSLALKPQDGWLSDTLAHLRPAPRFEAPFAVPLGELLASRGRGPADEEARYVADVTAILVHESGLASRFRQIAVEVKNPEAAKAWREHWIRYVPSSQRVQLVAARVLRKDGAVEDATSRETVSVSEPWYRLYYDVAAEVVQLPPLFPGDVVEYAYRIDDTAGANAFHDTFGDLVDIQGPTAKTLWRYALLAPASRDIAFNSPSLAGLDRRRAERDGVATTVFEARDVPAVKPEGGMPGMTSNAAYLHASTFRSWRELGAWFAGLIRNDMVADARIREKVKELTAGLADERAKVAAIYDWVVTSTRYVGLEFGVHGYEPYRAPLVMSRGFGDCKDKASLLVTMLAEAGVAAEFVLVRMRSMGDVGAEPASLAVFNHAIAHVPSLGLWLDGTAESFGSADLPFEDQDTLVLRLAAGGAVLERTPVMPREASSFEEEARIAVEEGGDARIDARISVRGEAAAALRRELGATATRKERFEASLAGTFPGARLEGLDFESLANLEKPVAYSYRASVPGYGRASVGRVEIPMDVGLGLLARFGKLARRTHDLVVGPRAQAIRNATVEGPAGFVPGSLPEPASIVSRFGRLSLAVRADGRAVRIERSFSLDVHRVAAADYPEFVGFCRAVDAALAQVIAMERRP
jgi:cellulose synthase operon protein C